MSEVHVILINPRLVTSNYPFDELWVGVDLGKHVFCDINAIPFLHEIQVFRHQFCSDTSEAQIINQNVLSGSVSNVQLLCLNPLILLMFSSVFAVDGLPLHSSSLTDSRPLLKRSWQRKTFDLVRVSLPKHFSNISNVCAPLNPFLTSDGTSMSKHRKHRCFAFDYRCF